MLGFTLYSWQVYALNKIQKAIESNNNEKLKYWTREFLALTSRQIGKSTAVAILAIWAAQKMFKLNGWNTVHGLWLKNTTAAKAYAHSTTCVM